ncbi:hypothetical protein AB0B57_27825 [Micromonospora sp. NPDC049101]|uniref:hypothetical protein n=1 Tax=Micromonospora sp. NPDC049101 TaxID=3155032 RepID=UPI0034069FAC
MDLLTLLAEQAEELGPVTVECPERSGLFNAAQQLGGSVGLAVLGTVSPHFAGQRNEQVIEPITTALPGDPGGVQRALLQATFTEGVTHAFLVGSFLLLIASLIVWTNTRMGTDGTHLG